MQYKIKRGLIFEKKGSKITIFDPEKSILYQFNETASFIFSKLKLGWQKEKIINVLIDKYNNEEISIKNDFINFIAKLKNRSLIIQPRSVRLTTNSLHGY
ncbi:MAG: PqqD family protein [Patescibacteria group bacterium]